MVVRSVLFVVLLYSCTCISEILSLETKSKLKEIARDLTVTYDVVDNIYSFGYYKFQIRFTNSGTRAMSTDGWSVYMCHIRGITSVDAGPGTITHINGCLHKIHLRESMPSGGEIALHVTGAAWAVSKTDVMPNWYIASDSNENIEPQIIANTAGETLDFVTSFNTPKKWKRYAPDQYDPYTPEKRYDLNKDVNIDFSPDDINIVPKPLQVTKQGKAMNINGDWNIEYKGPTLKQMAQTLARRYGKKATERASPSPKSMWLTIGDVEALPAGLSTEAIKDAYKISMEQEHERINILGKSASGVFYGVQTLLGLSTSVKQVPIVSILDAPRYQYRGYMLDSVRNFHPKETVLKMLDVMAMYKMNKLHLRLADDEGWRLEIPGLPELTEIGAKRCHDLEENTCTIPQLGSGPSPTTLGSGFYTANQYVEILKYAAERFIEVIPEFDMPGHAHAAIKSMLARYNKYKDSDMEKATKYLLSDRHDTSSYLSVQLYKDNAVNPCLNSTYDFVQKVAGEVVKMHIEGENALRVYHFGGDESPKGAWKNSPVCNSLRQSGVSNLGQYFAERVARTVKDLRIGAWEDGLLDGSTVYDIEEFPNKEVIAYAWQSVWEWGAGNRAHLLANGGFKVVMSQATHLYLDHPYEPDPEERGYYWATRFSGTRKVFGFLPDDLFGNVKEKLTGQPFSKRQFCAGYGACPTLNKPENIIGLQGAVFSETVRTREQLEYMTLPRLLAQAERAWHKASWETEPNSSTRERFLTKDWQRFTNILGHKELARLDAIDVKYRVPPPGARTNKNALMMNTEMPGLQTEYSTDGGKTWHEYSRGASVGGEVLLRSMSADGTRSSRIVKLVAPALPSTKTKSVSTGTGQKKQVSNEDKRNNSTETSNSSASMNDMMSLYLLVGFLIAH